jgi:hypothetical protein
MKMRHVSIVIMGSWLVVLGAAIVTGQLQHHGIFDLLSFCIGAATVGRIGFVVVPPNIHLWLILGLPLGLAVYAIVGDLAHLGTSVSWAIVGLSYIAGSRAANLRQLLQQGD